MAGRRSIISRPRPACRHRRRSRSRFQRNPPDADSNSSVRPSSTPSCRPPAWSTTIWSPAFAMKAARGSIARRASKPNDRRKLVRAQDFRPRLAADVVGAAARSPGSLAAGYRDRRYRSWLGARGALERPDPRRAYFLGGAAHAVGRSRDARADAAPRCRVPARGAVARCAGIRHRRHDLAVQGGAWRGLQGGGKTATCGNPYPLRIAAGAFSRDRAADQGSRQGRGLPRGDGTCRLCESRGEAPVRARSRSADFDPAGLPDPLDRGQGRKAVPGALQGADCLVLAVKRWRARRETWLCPPNDYII